MTKQIYYLILNQKIHFCCNENMRKCPPADALCRGYPLYAALGGGVRRSHSLGDFIAAQNPFYVLRKPQNKFSVHS